MNYRRFCLSAVALFAAGIPLLPAQQETDKVPERAGTTNSQQAIRELKRLLQQDEISAADKHAAMQQLETLQESLKAHTAAEKKATAEWKKVLHDHLQAQEGQNWEKQNRENMWTDHAKALQEYEKATEQAKVWKGFHDGQMPDGWWRSETKADAEKQAERQLFEAAKAKRSADRADHGEQLDKIHGLMQKLHEGAEGHDKRYHEHLLEQLHRLQQDNNPLMQPQQLEAVKALKDMIDNKAFHGMGQDLDVTQGQHELLEKLHADHLDAAKVSAKKAAAEKKERKAAAEKRPARADANDDEVRAMIDDLRAEMADIRKLMQELRGKVKQAQASGSGAASGHAGHGAAAGASGLLGGVQPGPFGRAGILLGGQDTFSGGAAAGTGSGAFDLFPAGSGTGSTDQPGGIGGSAVHGTEGSTSAGGNGSHDQFTRGFAGSTPAGAGSGGGR